MEARDISVVEIIDVLRMNEDFASIAGGLWFIDQSKENPFSFMLAFPKEVYHFRAAKKRYDMDTYCLSVLGWLEKVMEKEEVKRQLPLCVEIVW